VDLCFSSAYRFSLPLLVPQHVILATAPETEVPHAYISKSPFVVARTATWAFMCFALEIIIVIIFTWTIRMTLVISAQTRSAAVPKRTGAGVAVEQVNHLSSRLSR